MTRSAASTRRSKVFKAIRTLSPDDLVRGQYRGYRDEDGVAKDSNVETFAALRLYVDSWRWAGVPFYVRAGKHLAVDGDRSVGRAQASAADGVQRADAARRTICASGSGRIGLDRDRRAGEEGRCRDASARPVELFVCNASADEMERLRAADRRRDARRCVAVRARGRRARGLAHRRRRFSGAPGPCTSTRRAAGARSEADAWSAATALARAARR